MRGFSSFLSTTPIDRGTNGGAVLGAAQPIYSESEGDNSRVSTLPTPRTWLFNVNLVNSRPSPALIRDEADQLTEVPIDQLKARMVEEANSSLPYDLQEDAKTSATGKVIGKCVASGTILVRLLNAIVSTQSCFVY